MSSAPAATPSPGHPPREVIDDLVAEQDDLRALLASLAPEEWLLPTPAVGWDVRDQVAHLADTEEIAHDTATGGPRGLVAERSRFESDEDFTESACVRARTMDPAAVLQWWVAAARRNTDALRGLPRDARIPWGLGMGWKAFCTARLMEHWAHGLDIRAAAGRPGRDTERLRHVAWIGFQALPYALGKAGVEAPPGRSLRLDLVPPTDEPARWELGPPDATDVITGPASQWCRVAVQRMPAAEAVDLVADGPLAELSLRHARAFL